MSCLTCGHTVRNLAVGEPAVFWCPRCGAIMECHTDGLVSIGVPMLVERVKRFRCEVGPTMAEIIKPHWHRIGIIEAIYLPEDRT